MPRQLISRLTTSLLQILVRTRITTGSTILGMKKVAQSSCDGEVSQLLGGESLQSNVLELARKYHGIAIVWEHRFYGRSLPFQVDPETGLALAGYDAYKYLSNDQALEDIVFFATNFHPLGHDGASLIGNKVPWVWHGGSYAGTWAARIRQRNLDVIFASWASSAVVQAQLDASVYYNTIIKTMSSNCSDDTHAAIKYADQILTKGTAKEISLLKRAIFLTNNANPRQNAIFPNVKKSDDLTNWGVANVITNPYQGSPRASKPSAIR